MKTKEYPIKELVMFEMEEIGIWWLKYNEDHPSFPKKVKKEYREFVKQTENFCRENDFLLGNGSGCMVEVNTRNSLLPQKMRDFQGKEIEWEYLGHNFSKGVRLPFLLYPRIILKGDFPRLNQSTSIKKKNGIPVPYYGNHFYKKYIEDNNGECPLPLPKDVKWYVEKSLDEDKLYKVMISTKPEVIQEFILSVPKGVEMNEGIIQNSGYVYIPEEVDFSISEVDDLKCVDKRLTEFGIPVLDNDGNITKEEEI